MRTKHWKLLCIQCVSTKHDACEAAENGGGGVRVRGGEEEREAQPEHHWLCWRKTRSTGIGWKETHVTASEGELWRCSAELWGRTFARSFHRELSHYLLCTENRDSSVESCSSPSTPRLLWSLCRSHELFAPASLGQHVHLQPAQWLHDGPPEAWASPASSTCLHRPGQVTYSRAYTCSHFPCPREEAPAGPVRRGGLLQLHHQRCEADGCLGRASGAESCHDSEEVQDSPDYWRATTRVVRQFVALLSLISIIGCFLILNVISVTTPLKIVVR